MDIAKYLPLLAVLALAGCDISSNEPPPDPGIAAAEQAVKRILIDPESAQFSGILRNSETGAYCGFVNAKNRLGGYTGDKLFAAKDDVAVLIPASSDWDLIDAKYERLDRRLSAARSPRDIEDVKKESERAGEDLDRLTEAMDLVNEWCRPDLSDQP